MKSNEQNKKTREYLVKIMGLVYDVHTQTKHHVFVEFSGHVDNVQVRYYLNGWDKNKEFDYNQDLYLDNEEGLRKIIKQLKQLLASDAPNHLSEEASKDE